MLTAEQQAAVEARGNVLVMAGAGTGKTRTLVARVMDYLLRTGFEGGRRGSVERVLMVTFTDASGSEMRGRLREALEAAVAGHPEDCHLAEQLALVDRARIGTLHGFCAGLVREHFHKLDLDPQLVTLSEAQARRVAGSVLGRILDPLLDPAVPAGAGLRELAVSLLGGDPDAVQGLIRGIDRHASALPDPGRWIGEEIARWSCATPESWRRGLAQALSEWVLDWCARLEVLDPENTPGVACREVLRSMATRMAGAELDVGALLARLVEIDAAPWPPRRKERFRAPIEELFSDAEWFRHWIPPGGHAAAMERLASSWDQVRGWMLAALEVVRVFRSEYAAAKRELAALDFSDLEQFALRLLEEARGGVAERCRAEFEMVLVDEAQDLNAAQAAILQAIAREPPHANRFLVGDVKQSIYRFRLAEPAIFQDLAGRWGVPGGDGVVVPLTGNFRSDEGILAFVNAVSERLFDRRLGGVSYDGTAALRFGGTARLPQPAEGGPPVRVELLIHERRSSTSGEDPDSGGEGAVDATTLEARHVACLLKRLREEACPAEGSPSGEPRRWRWSEMAVLLRSPAGRSESYAREFRRLGVPIAIAPGPLFDQPEALDLMSVLQVLDNPVQDIPLAAVLRSPIGGIVEPNELAVIRLAAKGRPLWTALQAFPGVAGAAGGPSECGDGLEPGRPPMTVEAWQARARPKVIRLLGRLQEWRARAQRCPMEELVERIFDESGYGEVVRRSPQPEQGLAHLRLLLELARRFDTQQRGGLYRFLAYLETEREAGTEAPASTPGDAVRLLSIHRSKGLEFPVVVTAGLGTPFNLAELEEPVLMDSKAGLCPLVVASGSRRLASPVRRIAERRQLDESLGEEIRLLYVAFTRARHRLILVGTTSGSAMAEWGGAFRLRESPGRGRARRPLDWLGPILCELGFPVNDDGPAEGAVRLFEWAVIRDTGVREAEPASTAATSPRVAEAAVGTAAKGGGEGVVAGTFRYPHVAATLEFAKQSVTALRDRVPPGDADADAADGLRWLLVESDARVLEHEAAGGVGHGSRVLDARARGTAVHRFLEGVSLERTGSIDSLQAERDRLVAEGRLSAAEAGAVDLRAVGWFWASRVGREIAAVPRRVRREWPFTLRLSPSELRDLGVAAQPGLSEGEFVVVQGMVDLAVFLPGEIWLVDFKTDRVTIPDMLERARDYLPQVRIYSRALERIGGRPVTRRYLHFLGVGRTIECPEAASPAPMEG